MLPQLPGEPLGVTHELDRLFARDQPSVRSPVAGLNQVRRPGAVGPVQVSEHVAGPFRIVEKGEG